MTDAPAVRQDRDWRLIPEESRPGPQTMALDEVAARTAARGGPRTLRVYRWSPSCLSLGYSQDPETVDWGACADRDLQVTRRPTGGGAIYHDEFGDISYSIIAPADELPGTLLDAYHLLCEPLFTALSRLGVDATYAKTERPGVYDPACYLRTLHPAHDVVVGERKLSGNAQYRQKDAVVQHGSLCYDVDPDAHLAPFDDPPSSDTFRNRVVGITDLVEASRSDVVHALEDALEEWAQGTVGTWQESEVEAAAALADRKYGDDAWVRHGDDPTSLTDDRM